MKLLTKVAKGINFGDVSNQAVRNVLTEISKNLRGPFTEAEMEKTLEFFNWKCPYTGKDLRPLIEGGLGGYATDHIYPQNRKWCGLNVMGNLVIVDKRANDVKSQDSVEQFLMNDTKVLGTLDEETRKERLEKIKEFQKTYNYDPIAVRDVVSPMMEAWYGEVRKAQENKISEAMEELEKVGILPEIDEEKKPLPKTSEDTTAAGGAKGRRHFTMDQKYAAVACYLREKVGLLQVEEKVLGIPNGEGNGSYAKRYLNELGVQTGRKNPHSGLLIDGNIDDEIAKASGDFKVTLEEIKKRGL